MPKETNPRRPPLRFSLLDVMALIAAVALSLISRSLLRATIAPESYEIYDRRQFAVLMGTLNLLIWTLIPFLLTMPGWWRSPVRTVSSPGRLALLAIALASVLLAISIAAWVTTLEVTSGKGRAVADYYWLFAWLLEMANHAGMVVAAAWMTLALTGRWMPEPSWSDRWGRVVGGLWIGLGLTARMIEVQTLVM